MDRHRVLVLQGGGALGSYQAGVFQALDAAGFAPDWLAGISIGALNAAVIAGNRPADRMPRLMELWHRLTAAMPVAPAILPPPLLAAAARRLWSEGAALWVAAFGVPGFFRPSLAASLLPSHSAGFYDSSPLRQTLLDLVDFDYLNSGAVRLSVGAVNVATGNFAYFDNHDMHLAPEHIMASGALPPGLPPVAIGDELFWDGGLVSNTPLFHVLDREKQKDLLIFQVDLFPSRGPVPGDVMAAIEREKDIRYSSRTRFVTDYHMRLHAARQAYRALFAQLTPVQQETAEARLLHDLTRPQSVAITQLIYRRKAFEGAAKDYEFSRPTMREHWQAGHEDAQATLGDPAWLQAAPDDGIIVYDMTRPETATTSTAAPA